MNGIAGIYNLNGEPVCLDTLKAMVRAGTCHGQNNVFLWTNNEKSVGFAWAGLTGGAESFHTQRALSTPSPAGQVSANARIDNRHELALALAHSGPLSGFADADLILVAYHAWGRECPKYIQGDFAFAIWDECKKQLFCARDRLGSRAFYYHFAPARRFVWAGECMQLLKHPCVGRRLNEGMIAAHLVLCPGNPRESFFADIAQLPPAHVLWIDESGLHIERYWDIDPEYRLFYKAEKDYEEHFRSLLYQTVACRLENVGEAGILLSGGLDSGSIACAAGELVQKSDANYPKTVRAFSWAFKDLPECDERYYSDHVVEAFGLIPEYIAADSHWLLSDCDRPTNVPDDPTLLICPPLLRATLRRARELGTTVMLMGTGANELLGGNWPNYLDLFKTFRWRALGRDLWQHHRRNSVSWARLLWRHLIRPALPVSLVSLKRAPRSDYPEWINADFARRVGLEDIKRASLPYKPFRESARLHRYQLVANELETRTCLAVGRIHAEYAIEHCMPFRDARLFEFVLAVPSDMIWRGGESKYLVRRAMRGRLPEIVLTRQDTGSIQPLRTLGLRERGRPIIEAMLEEPMLARLGFADGDALRNAYIDYCCGQRREYPLNYALQLEIWLRQVFDDPAQVLSRPD